MASRGRPSGAGDTPCVLTPLLPPDPLGTVTAPGTDTGCKGLHTAGTEQRPRPGDPQPPAAPASNVWEGGRENRTLSQRRGREVGGSWRKPGCGRGDWEAGSAAHRIVRNIARAPLSSPDPPGSQSPPLCRGEPGVRRGHGGSQLSACGETLPKPWRGGGKPAVKGTPREQPPLCQAKDPP